jgi:hydroxyethylthiazole kinase-like uncharacterized protein yjeF
MSAMSTGLYTTAELRAIEADAQASLPAATLMQRAGRAAAAWIDARFGAGRSVLVVCGPGNNGGDGYACARELAARGHAVECVALAESVTDDARAARAAWQADGGRVLHELPADRRCDVVVDALFGIGLARPLAGRYFDAVRWIEAQAALVVALDVPSGLDADRGIWVGGVAGVHACATCTFLGAKPGLYTADGCDAAGEVFVDALGVDAPEAEGALVHPDQFETLLARRPRNTHKGSFGSVAVVGGGLGMVGAPLLAARAALRLGAGRVYVDCIGAPDLRFDPAQPELMFRRLASLAEVDAIVVGCGLGTDDAAAAALAAAFERSVPLVVDADALNLLAGRAPPDLIRGGVLEAHAAGRVLTPHPLEAARLLGATAHEVQADRVAAARALARQTASIVVLKGAGTVIAHPAGRWWINPTGGPALATAGTGDVLAGMIGAFIAQGIEPIQAALAAAWLHGRAADEHGGDVGLVAGELPARAARLLVRLRGEHAQA